MLNNFKSLITSMTWYLRSGVSPDPNNLNSTNVRKLKNMNHMASRKFAMTMVAIAVIAFMYFTSVAMLLVFDNDPHVAALVSMYKDMIVAVASIAATLVGIQGLVDWKHRSSGEVIQESEYRQRNDYSEEYVEEYLSGPKEEDYSLDLAIKKSTKN